MVARLQHDYCYGVPYAGDVCIAYGNVPPLTSPTDPRTTGRLPPLMEQPCPLSEARALSYPGPSTVVGEGHRPWAAIRLIFWVARERLSPRGLSRRNLPGRPCHGGCAGESQNTLASFTEYVCRGRIPSSRNRGPCGRLAWENPRLAHAIRILSIRRNRTRLSCGRWKNMSTAVLRRPKGGSCLAFIT